MWTTLWRFSMGFSENLYPSIINSTTIVSGGLSKIRQLRIIFNSTENLSNIKGIIVLNKLRLAFEWTREKGGSYMRQPFHPQEDNLICAHDSVFARLETGTYKPRVWLNRTSNGDSTWKYDLEIKNKFQWNLPVNPITKLFWFYDRDPVKKDLEDWGRVKWLKWIWGAS